MKSIRGCFTVHWAPPPGEPGDPAVSYWLEPSDTCIKADAEGNCSPSVVSCLRYRKIGSNPPETLGTGYGDLYYSLNGEATRRNYTPGGVKLPKGTTSLKFIWTFEGSETVCSVLVLKDGPAGQDAFRVDVDNEMIPVAVDVKGRAIQNFLSNPPVTYFAYVGNRNVTSELGKPVITVDHNNVVCEHHASTPHAVNIKVNKDSAFTDFAKTQVTLTFNSDKYGKAIAKISVVPNRPGDKALIYQLAPTPNALVYDRNDKDEPIGTNILEIRFKKTEGGECSELTALPDGLSLYGGFKKDALEPLNGTSVKLTSQSIVKADKTTCYPFYYVELWDGAKGAVGSTIVDRESIGILVNGKKGEVGPQGPGAMILDVDNEMIPILVNSDAVSIAQIAETVTCSAYVAGKDVTQELTDPIAIEVSNPSVIGCTAVPGKKNQFIVMAPSQKTYTDFKKELITLTATHPKYGKATTQISVVPNRAGENAKLYQLSPSLNALHYARHESGAPDGVNTLSVEIKVNDGQEISMLSDLPQGQYLYYGPNPNAFDYQSWEHPLDSWEIRDQDIVNDAEQKPYSSYFLELWQGAKGQKNSYMLDRESLPILLDGEKGDKGEKSIYGYFTTKLTFQVSLCVDFCTKPSSWKDVEIVEPKTGNPHNLWKGTIQLSIPCENGNVYESIQTVVDNNNLKPVSYTIRKCGQKGDKGDNGVGHRTSRWAVGEKYQEGANGETFFDIVAFQPDGPKSDFRYFQCIKSHTATKDNYPGSEEGKKYWKSFGNYGNIATDIILSRLILAEEIDVNSLTVSRLLTRKTENAPFVEISQGLFRVFSPKNPTIPGAEFGIENTGLGDEYDGCVVLRFYDKNGKLQYDLGPKGITKIEGSKLIPIYLALITTQQTPGWSDVANTIVNPQPTLYKKFQAGTVSLNSSKIYNSNAVLHGSEVAGTVIKDGWYLSAMSAESVRLTSAPVGNVIIDNAIAYPSTVFKRSMYYIYNGQFTPSMIDVYFLDKTGR